MTVEFRLLGDVEVRLDGQKLDVGHARQRCVLVALLVDVNHAPPNMIAALPGMTPELAERVVRRRDETGPFISVEEMAVDADLPPDVLPQLADFTIFLR